MWLRELASRLLREVDGGARCGCCLVGKMGRKRSSGAVDLGRVMWLVLARREIPGAVAAGRSWGWVMGRAVGPSHMSMEPGSAGSKVRGTQAASSSIRRTPKEYS